MDRIPTAAYGVLRAEDTTDEVASVAEHVRINGYGILDSGLSKTEIEKISSAFNDVHGRYIEKHGFEELENINEHNSIRCMLSWGYNSFGRIAFNDKLISLLKKLIAGTFILNQQNGIINPPRQNYNQGAWHRDLPYQHFISSTPLAINALYCVDDFTIENGATYVLPATHKTEAFPSRGFIEQNARPIVAKAGQYLVLDCMTFHAGGYNSTSKPRRAVNHLFTIPMFKQQITLSNVIAVDHLSAEEQRILGVPYVEASNVEDYLARRPKISR